MSIKKPCQSNRTEIKNALTERRTVEIDLELARGSLQDWLQTYDEGELTPADQFA